MSPFIYETIGFGGSVIAVFAGLPQIVQLLKTKDATGISLWSWLIWLFSDLMLLTYSVSIMDKVFIFLNTLNAVFALIIISEILLYNLKKKLREKHEQEKMEMEKNVEEENL
jgi:uncharacterized protein with PQ loop repeat